MTRVLKKAKERTAACRTCRAELAYEFSDVHCERRVAHDMSADDVYFIGCPICGNEVHVIRWSQPVVLEEK